MVCIKALALFAVFSAAHAQAYDEWYRLVDSACPGEQRVGAYGSTTTCFKNAHDYFLRNCLAGARSSKQSCQQRDIRSLFNQWWTASYRWHLAFYDCLERGQGRQSNFESRYLGAHGRGKRAAFRQQSAADGRSQAECNAEVKRQLDGCVGQTRCDAVISCWGDRDVTAKRNDKNTKVDAYKAAVMDCARGGGNGGQDIVDIAVGNTDFSTLVAAVTAADLVSTLKSPGPFTVFAPNNDAFARVPSRDIQALLQPQNKDALVQLLTYHVVPGKILSTDLQAENFPETVEGSRVEVRKNAMGVTVNQAKVLAADLQATNGVIHVIDQVITPPGFRFPA